MAFVEHGPTISICASVSGCLLVSASVSGCLLVNGWVEDNVFLEEDVGQVIIHNLFMLERMIEMAKVRKECLYVAFIDMEKA